MIEQTRRIGFPKVAATSALALLLATVGCDESGPLGAALDDATVQLTALSPGGTAPATPAYKVEVLNGVITKLKANADRGTPSQNAAALILIAQAQAGLAESPASDAAEHQRVMFNLLTGVEGALAQWQINNAAAEAASGYDPAPALAEIEAESEDRDEAVARAEARKTEVDASIKRLLDEAASTAETAKGRRATQADLANQVAGESAVRGEELIKQAAAIGREADALEAGAADLEAQAAKIAPESDEIMLAIQRLTSQRSLLDQSKAEILARAAAYAATARTALQEAAKDAAEIEKIVGELQQASEDGAAAYNKAVEGYQAAAATAARVTMDPVARPQAKLTEGSAKQSLGDVHWARAHGLARLIESIDALANAKPPLPQAAAYKAMAEEARESRAAALEGATEAYQDAFEAYEGAGAKGEAQDRMDRVRERLGKITKATSGGKVDLAAEMAGAATEEAAEEPSGEPADTEAAAETAAAPGADQTTVLGTLTLLIERSKAEDVDGVFELFHARDQATRTLLDTVRPFAVKLVGLDKACRAKFGKGLEATPVGQTLGKGMKGEQFKSLAATDFEVSESGDAATASHTDLPQPLSLVRVEGQWFVDFGGMLGHMGQTPGAADSTAAAKQLQARMGSMMTTLSSDLDQITADVESGKLGSIAAVGKALQERMAALFTGAPRPPGGG